MNLRQKEKLFKPKDWEDYEYNPNRKSLNHFVGG